MYIEKPTQIVNLNWQSLTIRFSDKGVCYFKKILSMSTIVAEKEK